MQVSDRLGRRAGFLSELARLDDAHVESFGAGHAARSVLRAPLGRGRACLGASEVPEAPAVASRAAGRRPRRRRSPRPSRRRRSRNARPPTHIVYGGFAYRVGAEGVAIGREADPQRRTVLLAESNSGVSRLHCEVVLRDGELKLRDLSSFGTFVNERKIAGETSARARRRDPNRLARRRAAGRQRGGRRSEAAQPRSSTSSRCRSSTPSPRAFGAVVLLFMLVSANALLDSRTVVDNLEAEARRWELRGADGPAQPRADQGAAAESAAAVDRVARGAREPHERDPGHPSAASRRSPRTRRPGARRSSGCAPSSRSSTSSRRSSPAVPQPTDDGARLRSFQGEGNRQYLDRPAHGRRERRDPRRHVDEHARPHAREHPAAPQHVGRAAAALAEVAAGRQHGGLADDADRPGTNVQIIGFSDEATWLIPGTEGKWVAVNDGTELDAPVAALRARPSRRAARACTRASTR